MECAWAYRHRPSLKGELLKRQEGQELEAQRIAWKAQHGFHLKYHRIISRGRGGKHAAVAVALRAGTRMYCEKISNTEKRTELDRRAYMYHVMISDTNVIICKDEQVEGHKNAGYKIHSGSSSEKTALEMAKRLSEEKFM